MFSNLCEPAQTVGMSNQQFFDQLFDTMVQANIHSNHAVQQMNVAGVQAMRAEINSPDYDSSFLSDMTIF